jgi:hypothetical protein
LEANIFEGINSSYKTFLEGNKIQMEDAGLLSGLPSLLYLGPILLLVLFINFSKIINRFRYFRCYDSAYLYSSLSVLIVIVVILFSSPFFTSIFYWFCFGIAISPFLQNNIIESAKL